MFRSQSSSDSSPNIGRQLMVSDLAALLENPYMNIRYVRSTRSGEPEKIYFLEDSRQFWGVDDEMKMGKLAESITVDKSNRQKLEEKMRAGDGDKSITELRRMIADANSNIDVAEQELKKLTDKQAMFAKYMTGIENAKDAVPYSPDHFYYIRNVNGRLTGFCVDKKQYMDMLERQIEPEQYVWHECRSLLHYLAPIDEDFSAHGQGGTIYVDTQTESKYKNEIRPRLISEIEKAVDVLARQHEKPLNINVFDVGCGQGLVGIEVAKRLANLGYEIKLFSSDISADNVERLRQVTPFQNSDAGNAGGIFGAGRNLFGRLFRKNPVPEHHVDLVNAIPGSGYGPPGCVPLDRYLADKQQYITAKNSVSIVISSGSLCLQVIPTQTSLDDMRIVQEMFKSGIDLIAADGMKPPLINPADQSTGSSMTAYQNHRNAIINPRSIDDGGQHWTIVLQKEDPKNIAVEDGMLNLTNHCDPLSAISCKLSQRNTDRNDIQSIILVNAYLRPQDSGDIEAIEACMDMHHKIVFYVDSETARRLHKIHENVFVAKGHVNHMLASMPEAASGLVKYSPELFVRHEAMLQDKPLVGSYK